MQCKLKQTIQRERMMISPRLFRADPWHWDSAYLPNFVRNEQSNFNKIICQSCQELLQAKVMAPPCIIQYQSVTV